MKIYTVVTLRDMKQWGYLFEFLKLNEDIYLRYLFEFSVNVLVLTG
jgi:hypothetical protein